MAKEQYIKRSELGQGRYEVTVSLGGRVATMKEAANAAEPHSVRNAESGRFITSPRSGSSDSNASRPGRS